MKVGRFLSYSGWETEEPTGLFQYSGSGYAPCFYGYYQQGISACLQRPASSPSWRRWSTTCSAMPATRLERDTKKPAYELGVAVMPVEGLTAKAFYMSDDEDRHAT